MLTAKMYRYCCLGFWSEWKPYSRLISWDSVLHPGMTMLRVWRTDGTVNHHVDRFEVM